MRADRCVFCEQQGRANHAQGREPRGQARSTATQPGARGVVALAAATGLLVMATSVVLWIGMAPSEDAIDEPAVQTSVAAVAAVAVEEPEIETEPRLVVPSAFGLRFEGRVRKSAGMDVGRRAKCALEAQVRGEHVRRVTLSCDDELVYDSEMPMSGISSRGSELHPRHEELEPRFALDFYDMGQRTGRPSIRVSSVGKSVEVFDVFRPGALLAIEIDEIGAMVPPSD
jgi:hypothetical protein